MYFYSLLLLVFGLFHSMVVAMELPLASGIESFPKYNTVIYNIKRQAAGSRFSFCAGLKTAGLNKITTICSLEESFNIFGLVPKLDSKVGRMAVFDLAGFPDAAKLPTGDIYCSKMKILAFSSAKPREESIVGTLMAMCISSYADASSGFLGFSLEVLEKGDLMVKLYFMDSAEEKQIEEAYRTEFTTVDVQRLENQAGGSIYIKKSQSKTLQDVWQLRSHRTGRHICSFIDREILRACLEWVRPENFWDLILVKEGEWDKILHRKMGMIFVHYEKEHFNSGLLNQIDEIGVGEASFMGLPLAFGMNHVKAIYFSDLESNRISICLMAYANVAFKLFKTVTENPLLEALCQAEVMLKAREVFESKYLANRDSVVNSFKVSEFTFISPKGKKKSYKIGSLEDFLKIRDPAWAQSPKLLTGESLFLSGQAKGKTDYVISVVRTRCLPKVILQIFSLLLSHPNAYWASAINAVEFLPYSEKFGSKPKQAGKGSRRVMKEERKSIERLDTSDHTTVIVFFDHLAAPKNFDFRDLLGAFMPAATDAGTISANPGEQPVESFAKYQKDAQENVYVGNFEKGPPRSLVRDNDLVMMDLNPYLDDPKKSRFGTFSRISSTEDFVYLGVPRLILTEAFLDGLNSELKNGQIGIVSEFWQKNPGSVHLTRSYGILRQRVSSILAKLSMFIEGCPDIFGTTLLATFADMKEIVDFEAFAELTLIIDPGYKECHLEALLKILGLDGCKYSPSASEFIDSDWSDGNDENWQTMKQSWFLHNPPSTVRCFNRFQVMKQHMHWIKPELLENLELEKRSLDGLPSKPDTAQFTVIMERAEAISFVLDGLETYYNIREKNAEHKNINCLNIIRAISFIRHDENSNLICVKYTVNVELKIIRHFESIIEKKMMKYRFAIKHQLRKVDQVNLVAEIGTVKETFPSSFQLESFTNNLEGIFDEDTDIVRLYKNDLDRAEVSKAIRACMPRQMVCELMKVSVKFMMGGVESPDFSGIVQEIILRPNLSENVKFDNQFECFLITANDVPIDCIVTLQLVLSEIFVISGKIARDQWVGEYDHRTNTFTSKSHHPKEDLACFGEISEMILIDISKEIEALIELEEAEEDLKLKFEDEGLELTITDTQDDQVTLALVTLGETDIDEQKIDEADESGEIPKEPEEHDDELEQTVANALIEESESLDDFQVPRPTTASVKDWVESPREALYDPLQTETIESEAALEVVNLQEPTPITAAEDGVESIKETSYDLPQSEASPINDVSVDNEILHEVLSSVNIFESVEANDSHGNVEKIMSSESGKSPREKKLPIAEESNTPVIMEPTPIIIATAVNNFISNYFLANSTKVKAPNRNFLK